MQSDEEWKGRSRAKGYVPFIFWRILLRDTNACEATFQKRQMYIKITCNIFTYNQNRV